MKFTYTAFDKSGKPVSASLEERFLTMTTRLEDRS